MRGRVSRWLVLLCLESCLSSAAIAQEIQFNRDIRPLLSEYCFQCHGPDEAQRKAGLRLDTETGAFAEVNGGHPLVKGQPEESEVWLRISSDDPELQMPPAKTGKKLKPAERDLIRKWIASGARWQGHWAWLPPQRPDLPAVKQSDWCRSPLDRFVLARLEQAGLQPSPEADRITWLRRVTLDLTGLPPTPHEVEQFVADSSPQAYETVVDRLLKSPRYGERMAVRWLDGARYADTNGYQSDGERDMWRWRDWVIEAYNQNIPFDQFTVEQLAGDLLPQPTLEQRIATGFNRNHRGNAEGGIVPEEYAVEYVVDRVDTTFTVWMGLTMGCARCHDHKFDPLSQRDYYQVFALFNNVPEKGRAIKFGNSPPYIPAPTREQQQQVATLEQQLVATKQEFAALRPELQRNQQTWSESSPTTQPTDGDLTAGLLVNLPLDGTTGAAMPAMGMASWKGGSGAFAQGRRGLAAKLDGTSFLDAGDLADFGYTDRFTCGLWVRPAPFSDDHPVSAIIGRGTDAPEADGWSVVLVNGKVQVRLTKRWLDDALRVETLASLTPEEWQHLTVTYDGSRTAAGVGVFVNGEPLPVRTLLDELNQTITSKEPLRIGGGGGPQTRFRGQLDEVRIYRGVLSAEEVSILATGETLAEILALQAGDQTPGQQRKLAQYYLQTHAPEQIRQVHQRLVALQQQLTKLRESFPTVMVMEELPVPRETHILKRGEYDKPGERVEPGVPEQLRVDVPASIRNRLDFAKWLVRPEHPLTSRVAVNRLWQMLFGQGLVRTVDDLGSQGAIPSHPELLDWLATELTTHGWDQKRLLKEIVLSATYRQSSRASAVLLQRDPENVLLARGPRQRLAPEMIRDQALFASGLLKERQGGPSVSPYQPDGLWNELTENATYVQSHGDDLYRRGMYTFWKRTIPPPGMVLFDAAGREACMVRESRTNTPLQALNLMNDVTFLEAARLLAQRGILEADAPKAETNGSTRTAARITRLYQLLLSRSPTPRELEILVRNHDFQREHFLKAPMAAEQYLQHGEAPRDPRIPVEDLAALTTIAQLLLNLDEAVTKR